MALRLLILEWFHYNDTSDQNVNPIEEIYGFRAPKAPPAPEIIG
jgi:hypothetical protein